MQTQRIILLSDECNADRRPDVLAPSRACDIMYLCGVANGNDVRAPSREHVTFQTNPRYHVHRFVVDESRLYGYMTLCPRVHTVFALDLLYMSHFTPEISPARYIIVTVWGGSRRTTKAVESKRQKRTHGIVRQQRSTITRGDFSPSRRPRSCRACLHGTRPHRPPHRQRRFPPAPPRPTVRWTFGTPDVLCV